MSQNINLFKLTQRHFTQGLLDIIRFIVVSKSIDSMSLIFISLKFVSNTFDSMSPNINFFLIVSKAFDSMSQNLNYYYICLIRPLTQGLHIKIRFKVVSKGI